MVTDEQRQHLLNTIKELRTSVLELHKIAPDTVPHHILTLCEMNEEKVAQNIDNDLQAIENNEELSDDEKLRMQNDYVADLIGLFGALDVSCNEFKADLQKRLQPEGVPRQKRQINQFKKRRGTW